MRKIFLSSVGVALAMCLASLDAEAKPLSAVASFTILADMVRVVGGDKIQVASLVGPNGDPHSFEPTPSDARTLKDADIVFVNGLGLEGWMERLIVASGQKRAPVVASDGITTRKMDEDGRTILDPHAWNAAANAIVYVHNIAKALSEADPADAGFFDARAEAYVAQLSALDRRAKTEIAALPATRRKILTTHDALGYFAAAYGVEILSPLGFSTEQEPSAASMAALIQQIRKERIKTYFLENSNDPRLIQQIARATNAQPGGDLYVESLSKADGPAASYLTMFQHNLDLILRAMREQA